MALDNEQRAIARSAVAAFLVTAAVLFVTASLPFFETDTIEDRLTLLVAAFAPLALVLVRDIGRLANHRFFERLDRNAAAADTKTAKADMLSAILRNTHEQVTLAMLIYAIAAITLPPRFTDAILACSALFLTGRVVFAAGYAKGAGRRAFGFGLTFYPSIVLALSTATIAFI